MADWVDSLSDDEVKALFKYKQGGVDSLSDAEVQLMYPHKDKLTSAPSTTEPLVGNGEGFWDKAVGLGQAAAQVVSGGVGMVGAIVPTALQKLNNPSGVDFEKQYAENINRFTYEPTREKGQEYANVAGEFINRNLVPLAPVLHGIPSIKASEAGNAVRSRLRTNEVPPSSLSSLKAEITAPEPVKAPVVQEPGAKAFQGITDRLGYQEGEFSPLTRPAPMETMATDLARRGEETRAVAADEIIAQRQAALEQEVATKTALDKNAAERARQEQQTTLSPEHRAEIAKRQTEADILFDDQLKQIEQQRVELEQQKARIATEEQARAVQEAQRVLDERQRAIELEVTKQQRMDFGAAERARQEAATQFPGPLGSKHRAEWVGLKERAAETRKLIDEQARKTAEIEKAWENRPNSPERAKARLDEEAAKRDMEEHLQSLEQKMRELANKYEKTGQGPKTRAAKQEEMRRRFGKQAGAIDPDLLTMGLTKLFHGGREFSKWLPHTIGKGEGMKALGPGLYAGDKKALASLYKKYGDVWDWDSNGDFNIIKPGVLSEMAVDMSKFIDPRKEMSPAQRASYTEAVKALDKMGLRASTLGIKAALRNSYDQAATRKALIDAGIDGMWEDLGGDLGREIVIYNPEVIKQISREDSPVEKYKGGPARSPGNRQGGFISFGKKNTADAISKVPGMESIRKIGHAGIESAEQAISLAKSAPDVQQSTVGRAFNWLTKGGEYLKARVDNPVFHYAVDTMLRGKDLANAAISEKLHGEYLPAMRALSKQEFLDVADLLNTADMYQKTITPEMLAKHGVSEHVARAIETHQRLMSEAGEMVNRAREAAGKKPIPLREAYSSMSFKGNYRKVVTKDGEVVGVLTGETKKQLAKAEEWLKTNHPEYEAGALQDRTQYSSLAKVSPHEGFNAVLENLASDNPHMAEFQKALKDLAAQEEHSYMGMNKHTMGKKGVFGAEGRKPWLSESENAKALVENQAKYLENALSWGHLAEAATEVNKVLKDESVMAKHPNAVLMAEQYMRQALGINSHSFGKTLTQGIDILSTGVGSGPAYVREAMRGAKMGVNAALFAFNHVFLGLQLLQPLMNMPALAVLLKNHGLSTHTTGTFGLGSFVQAHATYVKNALGKELSAVESQALKYAKENHIYADDMIEHSTSVRNDLGYKASKVTQYAQTKVEKATRAQMFMAMVHLMKEAGVKPADGLFQQAHRFTDMGMNRMDALEKPQVYEALGPLGNAAYNLSSFKHNELSRWSLYVDEIARNGNVKSAAPLLTQMATVVSMAGVMGLPFFALASQLYDKITELLGSPRSLITDVYSMSEAAGKHIGDKGAYALSNGFTSMLGPDVSRRLGLGDIAPDNVADAMFPGISKLGQIAASSAKAAYHVDKPEYWKAAAYNIAPGSLQGPADVSWFQRGDLAYSKNPDDVKTTVSRTAQDTLMRKIGLTGINESVQKTKNYENNKLEQKFTELRKKAMNGVKQDYLNNRDMGQSIDKWIAAQGDPASFDREVDAALVGLSISPQDKALIKDAASKSLSKQYDLQRRTR